MKRNEGNNPSTTNGESLLQRIRDLEAQLANSEALREAQRVTNNLNAQTAIELTEKLAVAVEALDTVTRELARHTMPGMSVLVALGAATQALSRIRGTK